MLLRRCPTCRSAFCTKCDLDVTLSWLRAGPIIPCGVSAFIAYAQSFYFLGHLSPTDLPENFHQAADTFGWMSGDLK